MIGNKLKDLRNKRGLTQKELAEKAQVAVGTIQQYELEKRQPRADILAKISDILGVPISYFFISDAKPDEPIDKETPQNAADIFNALIESINNDVPIEYLLGETGISDIDLFNFSTFSESLKADNILRGMSFYDYDKEVIQGIIIMLGNLFGKILSHIWDGKSVIRYNNLDNIYLLTSILNIFFGATVMAKQASNSVDSKAHNGIKNELIDKLLPSIDAWIDNYLQPHRQLPHYENEIKQFNNK